MLAGLPSGFGYSEAIVVVERPTPSKVVPQSYSDVYHMADAKKWLEVMDFETELLIKT